MCKREFKKQTVPRNHLSTPCSISLEYQIDRGPPNYGIEREVKNSFEISGARKKK